MNRYQGTAMTRISLIRISLSIVLAAICLALTGCGEHAEPIDLPGATSLRLPGMP